MSSTNIEVVFEGPAVKTGTIDARVLGDSLMGYSEVFTRANALVNGVASEAAVRVQSDFRPGSFVAGLELVQNLGEQAHQLITAHPFFDATGLATIIGFVWKNRDTVKDSLIDLYKWLRGKKPDKVVQVGNNTEITFGQNKKTVNNIIVNMYSDPGIRDGLGRLTNPLRHAEIDRILVKQDGEEQTAIEKSEAEYFEAEPLPEESADIPMEGERDAVLIVSKLSFTEGSTWTFFERGATVVAKIEDERLWEQVHQHNVTFGEGDQLRVRLVWKIEKKRKLVQKNTIVRVHEVMERPKQMRLDGGKDDEILPRPSRKIREE